MDLCIAFLIKKPTLSKLYRTAWKKPKINQQSDWQWPSVLWLSKLLHELQLHPNQRQHGIHKRSSHLKQQLQQSRLWPWLLSVYFLRQSFFVPFSIDSIITEQFKTYKRTIDIRRMMEQWTITQKSDIVGKNCNKPATCLAHCNTCSMAILALISAFLAAGIGAESTRLFKEATVCNEENKILTDSR